MTEFFDISGAVNDLRNSVENISDVTLCCNYQYQILDKFCASMPAVSTVGVALYGRCVLLWVPGLLADGTAAV